MEVTVAKTAGFCFGVKRAVDKVYESVGCGKKIYTLGPIIHNSEVVKDLEAHGVITLKDETMLDTVDSGGVVIIRSHGVPKRVIDLLEQKNIKYIVISHFHPDHMGNLSRVKELDNVNFYVSKNTYNYSKIGSGKHRWELERS